MITFRKVEGIKVHFSTVKFESKTVGRGFYIISQFVLWNLFSQNYINHFIQMEKRKDPLSVDIQKVLLDMREYRMGLIQTSDQLRFSYMAIREGARGILGDSSLQVVYIMTIIWQF